MPIRKVQFNPGNFYHIFNRGNGKQNIFNNKKDMYRFLQAMLISNNNNLGPSLSDLERRKQGYTLVEIKKLLDLQEISQEPLVHVYADCLMQNHYHFLLQEIEEKGISRFMHRLGNSYGRYFSIKYDRPGALFQGRFKVIEVKTDEQLKYLLVYINVLNPAELVEPNLKELGIKNPDRVWKTVQDYSWSTHQEYMGRRESILVEKGFLEEFFPTSESYLNFAKDVLYSKERETRVKLKDLIFDQ